MSYDLEVVTRLKPLAKHFEEFPSSSHEYCFLVDGPFVVELEDLDEQVIASVLDPQWLTQFSVPAACSDSDLKLAKQLAKHIADACHGSVYDPQLDKVIWPRQSRRRFVTPRKAREERIKLLNLDWYLPASQSSVDTAKLFLQILRKICPEALPRRFGTFEPFQHRLDAGDESFLSVWAEVSRDKTGDMFFWKAKKPFDSGYVCFPDQREPQIIGAKRPIHLSIDVDNRALEGNAAWCETVVNLFIEVARKLRAFYANGSVGRNVTVRGRWWLGLPPAPTWLVWFGAGYRNALEASLEDRVSVNTPQGILLRHGAAPLDIDQLSGVFPSLPQSLFTEFDGSRAADVIPELE
jgi:hypothetical protein